MARFIFSFITYRELYTRNFLAVIFTDERRFNLERPNGLRHYYHDLRKEQQLLNRRSIGGGGIMI